jgi:hypothetical protein
MLYTLIYNNRIITGPRDWSSKYFEYFLKSECNIETSVPEIPIDTSLNLSNTTQIVPTYFDENPTVDDKFEQIAGPRFYFDEANNHRAAYYTQEHDLPVVVANLKSEVAQARWALEVQPITRDIQGKELTLYTDRESRAAYAQALITAADDYAATWKFPQGFVTLNKPDLQLIIAEINTHVQNCFNWEADKNAEIDSKTSVAELRNVILTPQ